MELSTEALGKFKKMYADMYGVQLSSDEAREFGTRLVILVKAVYGKNLPKRFDNKIKRDK